MSFKQEIIDEVWEKAAIVSENNQDYFRKDQCGAWIAKSQYGNRDSIYGWEIDHIKPISKGGTDELSNLCPLQWENNISKSDERLVCAVTAQGTKNIKIE